MSDNSSLIDRLGHLWDKVEDLNLPPELSDLPCLLDEAIDRISGLEERLWSEEQENVKLSKQVGMLEEENAELKQTAQAAKKVIRRLRGYLTQEENEELLGAGLVLSLGAPKPRYSSIREATEGVEQVRQAIDQARQQLVCENRAADAIRLENAPGEQNRGAKE